MAAFSGNVSGFGASYYEFIAASGVKMTTYAAHVGHLHEMIERSMESWNAYWSYYQRVRPAIDERGLTYEEAVQYEKLAKTCIADLMTAEYYLRYLASCVDGKIDVVIFFSDPLTAQPHDPDVKALLRIAQVYDIPIANNRATADFIIKSPLMERSYSRYLLNFRKNVEDRAESLK